MEGLTWAAVAALIGAAVNLVFNTINYFANRNTRRNASALSDFNSNFRNRINEALAALDGIMDEADDIARSTQPHADKLVATKELGKKFHAARRVLARHLNDCDVSNLVNGNDWARCDEGYMDKATDAFEAAQNTDHDHALNFKLVEIARAINSLRTELRSRLDAEAHRLMR